MFKKYKNQIIGTLILVSLALPAVSFAQLVPCGRTGQDPCTLCDLYLLLDNIIDFLMLYIAPSLAVLVIAWGGFYILVAGGEPAKKQAGFNAIKTAVIGLLVVFGAWVIVNEVLLFFSQQGTGTAQVLNNPWTEIQCR